MADLSTKDVRRLVGEFILIVAGVTVALAADSAWAAREDRTRADQYVAQLRSDAAENSERLLAAIELEEMQGQAALAAFRATVSGERISPDSARAWLVDRRGLYYSDPRLVTGTFNAIVVSGDLRLIEDGERRNAIVAYVPQVTADRAEFDRWVGIYLDRTALFREAGARSVPYDPTPGGPEAAALAAGAAVGEAIRALDAAIFANRVRLTYLHRMLDATVTVRAALDD